ncbi:MAG: methyltransferase domain-containing protein [Chloroflexi bacterium]|nr:methyltransferase domain-containing protein [Chloroflexota bacterium]
MATVFMQWLETKPKDYDRGIQLLTLGRLTPLKEKIAADYIRDGTRVLEIGCGTGTLTKMMADSGATVTAIDTSPGMLAEAERGLELEIAEGRVTLELMDATQIGDHLPPASFDLIVSTLVFSEIQPEEQRYILESCKGLLCPRGCLLIVDEVIPSGWINRILYFTIRFPLALITWLLTRTTNTALQEFDSLLTQTGYQTAIPISRLGGSLLLYEAIPAQSPISNLQSSIHRLQHRVTLRTIILDLWTLFFRIMPPYPKVKPGLYAIGEPNNKSPVLVTGNFDLTVRRMVKAIDGKVNGWLLVADSAGINVWCAAGGGYFTAEKIIAAVKSSHLEEFVEHHSLILPQLAANGVDGWKIRTETGWGVRWGPVKAEDISEYLAAKRKKTDEMRWVQFPIKDRLEMVTVTLGFYSLMILVPVLIFWRQMFWPITASLLGLSYFYAVVHPWLPGRDGLWKSIPLTIIALTGLFIYSYFITLLPPHQLFNWIIGLTALSVFIGAELQGMSPLMRGEQANWGWEVGIGVALGLVYWLVFLLE